jgi:hypothetical protein
VATAVVAALIALVGVLVVRTVFRVAGYDTSGVAVDGSTVVLCLLPRSRRWRPPGWSTCC